MICNFSQIQKEEVHVSDFENFSSLKLVFRTNAGLKTWNVFCLSIFSITVLLLCQLILIFLSFLPVPSWFQACFSSFCVPVAFWFELVFLSLFSFPTDSRSCTVGKTIKYLHMVVGPVLIWLKQRRNRTMEKGTETFFYNILYKELAFGADFG